MIGRYKKRGWFNDSYRHYLAAKGVSTKHKYFVHNDLKGNPPLRLSFSEFLAEAKNSSVKSERKKGIDYYDVIEQSNCAECDEFYSMKDPEEHGFLHSEKIEGVGRDVRQRDIMSLQNRVLADMDRAMKDKELSGQDREFFLRTDFKQEAEEYLNGRQSKEDFEGNVQRKLDSFLRINSKKLPVFGWDKGVDR